MSQIIEISTCDERYHASICRWVFDQKTLNLISGDVGEKLTPDILKRWLSAATESLCLFYRGELAGFATISDSEFKFPGSVCEVCHFIISPYIRRKGMGTILLHAAVQEIRKRGYDRAIGRMVPDNVPAIKMIEKAGWIRLEDPRINGPFKWYIRDLNDMDDKRNENVF